MSADPFVAARRALGRGASIAVVAKISAKLTAFLMAVVLARALPVEDYGAFVLLSTWLLLLMILGVMGLDNAAMRFVAQYAETGDNMARIASFHRWAATRILAAGSAVAVVAGGVVWALFSDVALISPIVVATAGATLPLLAYAHFAQFALRGFRRVGRAEFVGQIARPATLIVVVGVATWLAITRQLALAVAALLAGTALSAALGRFWLRQSMRHIPAAVPDREDAQLWKRTAFPMLLITTSHFLLHQLDVLMLGAMSGAATVAPYAVASRLADIVAFALAAASSIVAPMIAGLYHSGANAELNHVLRTAARWVSGAALVLAVVLILGPIDFLAIFGDQYSAAYPVLVILVAGQLLNAFAGPVGFLLSMTGQQMASATILGTGVVLNAVLNLALIPRYQEMGAAIATATTATYWNITMTIYASRKLGLRATPF